MTNEEKLEYIKSNYKVVREYKSLKKENNYFYNEWVNKTSKILPSKLYKYRKCNNNNLRALQNKKAWFSKPSTWNDKIDVTVRYNLKKDLEYIDEHFDDFVLNMAFGFSNKHIQSFCKQKGFSGFEKIKDIYFSVFSKEKDIKPNKINEYLIPIVGLKNAKQITSKIQETLAIIMNDKFKSKILNLFNKLLLLNNIRDKLLMFSLSETYNNGHQWAIYADDGRGFCVGYSIKPKNKKEESLLMSLLPIYYGVKEEYSLSKMLYGSLKSSISPELLQKLIDQEAEKIFISFLTKDKEWSGEQEWRFSIDNQQCDSNLIEFDFAEAIYLDESISEYWKNRLIKIAKKQNLLVYQRKLDNLKSKWIYEEIAI